RSRRQPPPAAPRRPRREASAESGRRSRRHAPAGEVAELDVVDVVRDRRMLAADRAVRVALDHDLVERSGKRVEEEEPAGERVARADHELERLARLQRADDAWKDAENAALGAAGCQLRRWRSGEEAAVAGPDARVEHRHLALEAVDRAVHDRN